MTVRRFITYSAVAALTLGMLSAILFAPPASGQEGSFGYPVPTNTPVCYPCTPTSPPQIGTSTPMPWRTNTPVGTMPARNYLTVITKNR